MIGALRARGVRGMRAGSEPISSGDTVIPVKADSPSRAMPVVTIFLILMNVAAYFWQASLGPEEHYGVLRWGLTPIELRGVVTYAHGGFDAKPILTIFTSMFLHGHLLHLAANMLFLWIFGATVEHALGPLRFLAFYLITGTVGALTQVFTMANPTVPMIGASGAVSGVLGGYLVLRPYGRIHTLIPLFFYMPIIRIPALLFLAAWFVVQLVSSATTHGDNGAGIAFLAHIGGFVAGVILVTPLSRARPFRIARIFR